MKHIQRHQSEIEFYEDFYKDGWEKQDQRIDESIVPRNMRIYLETVKDHIDALKRSRGEITALDCGCGHGVLSVLVARMGVKVTAVDISPRSIEILAKFARTNEVEDDISTLVAPLEDLPLADNSFDCLLGTRVLHHVDVQHSAQHLVRVLKPGGKGIFWECTDTNAALRLARRLAHRVPFVPKFGTAHEHPLTHEEIDALGRAFGKPAVVVDAPFFFFGFLDRYLLFRRLDVSRGPGDRLDAFLARHFPRVNRHSFHKVLILEKSAGEAENPRNDSEDR